MQCQVQWRSGCWPSSALTTGAAQEGAAIRRCRIAEEDVGGRDGGRGRRSSRPPAASSKAGSAPTPAASASGPPLHWPPPSSPRRPRRPTPEEPCRAYDAQQDGPAVENAAAPEEAVGEEGEMGPMDDDDDVQAILPSWVSR
ncbi:unnamed protein product [Urochloa humidicola]